MSGGIPRYRPFDGPALLHAGFRPFFLGAALWSAIALGLWLGVLMGQVMLPIALDPVAWHAHEMIFGFAAAAVGGFLLTAIPNWTGRLPIQGGPLAVLALAWLAGRVAVVLSALIGAVPAAVADLSYLVLLLLALVREIVAGRNWRNLPMPGALSVLIAANLLIHLKSMGLAETAGVGIRLGIGVLLMLISLIGGRIIPSFTRNWLVKRRSMSLPAAFGFADRLALFVTALGIACWIAAIDDLMTGILLVTAGCAAMVRLVRWRGYLTAAEPLLWSLHLGHAWLAVGLALLGLSHLWPDVPATAALHALTAGAIGTMALAVMTRASLGHTGRPLVAGARTTAIYLLITSAALLRVAAAITTMPYVPLLAAAGAAWIGAFLLFALAYARPLLTPRTSSPAGAQ
jgi:uncharacterized protein involved in response to NO